MITLYGFGAGFGLPDASPFVIKTQVLLQLAGQPYVLDQLGLGKAPKGKLPYLDDAGTVVSDSTFIRWHLEKKYGVDFDQGLSAAQRAVAWAAEKLLEDNLYWIGVYWRWLDDRNFAKFAAAFFAPVPLPMRGLVKILVRRRVRTNLYAQGIGRHSETEMLALARCGIDALATLLGDKPFLMGEQPCSTDAMLFASMASALCPFFESPLKELVVAQPHLVAYESRMRQRFFAV